MNAYIVQAYDTNFGVISEQMVHKVTRVNEMVTKEEAQEEKPSGSET